MTGLIWVFKTSSRETETTRPASTSGVPTTSSTDSQSEHPVADFSLFVTEPIDFDRLTSYGIPIMIDFGADSCVPCKEMSPVLKKLNAELQGKAIIRFIDVWKD